jgi:ribosomal protein L11 methyltransferase
MSSSYYYELVVTPSIHYELFLDFILQLQEIGLEELDNSIILRSEEPFENEIWAIHYFRDELNKTLGSNITVDIVETKKEHKDWVENFQKSVQPVFISPFYIHPSWHSPKEGAENILIDPALAFGSGHHETTSSVIELLSQIVQKDEKVLDVGAGSGILSLISAKIGAKVDFCDIDPLSVESSISNFEKNSLAYNRCWEGSANGTDESYSLVIANIIPDVIIAISNHLKKRVSKNGKLILSGILNNKERLIYEYFSDFEVIKRVEKGEWITLLLKREGL